jgi:hypothetical protein
METSAAFLGVIVKVYEKKVWIETDFMGDAHVMVQHDDGKSEPFTYCSFFYDQRYTSNSSIRASAINMALSLGATEPVAVTSRPFDKLLYRVNPA